MHTYIIVFPELKYILKCGIMAFYSEQETPGTRNFWCQVYLTTANLSLKFGFIIDFNSMLHSLYLDFGWLM